MINRMIHLEQIKKGINLQSFYTKRVIVQSSSEGTLAQLVEQWTENPCVPGSIPGGTTITTLIEACPFGQAFFLLST